MKKALSLFLALTLSLALAVPAFAAQPKSFRDVPGNHWAHDAIMDMVSMGLLAGTTSPDANGVADFNPDGAMNRSHFVMVIARYLYGEELAAMPKAATWYGNAYTLLLNKGILKKTDFENGNLEVAMSRQEMAYVLAKAADAQNKAPDSLVATSKIPDYNSISSSYKDSVVKTYSMGLIAGTDNKGTFNPYGTLNRAQASTVIYRLVNFKNGENNSKVEGNLTEKEITNEWDGKGVNISKFWDPADPLAGMPNTAAVAEKYGVEAGGYGYAVAMNFVNVDNSIITDGLVLNGFGYSANEPDRYETSIAMLKDVLDAESASAFISELEKIDKANTATMNALITYGRDSKEFKSAVEINDPIIDSFYNALENDYVTFGNVKIKCNVSGNNIQFCILNK